MAITEPFIIGKKKRRKEGKEGKREIFKQ